MKIEVQLLKVRKYLGKLREPKDNEFQKRTEAIQTHVQTKHMLHNQAKNLKAHSNDSASDTATTDAATIPISIHDLEKLFGKHSEYGIVTIGFWTGHKYLITKNLKKAS